MKVHQIEYKCIEDDTKAAKAQTALRKQKIKYSGKKFSIWPIKSFTLQCGTWL